MEAGASREADCRVARTAQISVLLDLSSWPERSRVLERREEPHPGASYNMFHPKGLRHQASITTFQDTDVPYLGARHRLLQSQSM